MGRLKRSFAVAGGLPTSRDLLFKAAENVRATASRPFLLQPELIRSLHSSAPLIRQGLVYKPLLRRHMLPCRSMDLEAVLGEGVDREEQSDEKRESTKSE